MAEVPYLKWRNGRPRWEPGPGLRVRGFKGRDLRRDDGSWLSPQAAAVAAAALNAGITRADTTPTWRIDLSASQQRLESRDRTWLRRRARDVFRCEPQALPSAGAYVYIFGFSEWVKIGVTSNPRARFLALAGGLPGKLQIHLLFEGRRQDEQRLHRIFAHHRENGEWFRLAGNLASWVSLCREIGAESRTTVGLKSEK